MAEVTTAARTCRHRCWRSRSPGTIGQAWALTTTRPELVSASNHLASGGSLWVSSRLLVWATASRRGANWPSRAYIKAQPSAWEGSSRTRRFNSLASSSSTADKPAAWPCTKARGACNSGGKAPCRSRCRLLYPADSALRRSINSRARSFNALLSCCASVSTSCASTI